LNLMTNVGRMLEPTMGAAAEVTREIAHGHTGFLHLRYRRNGGTASSVGGAGNSNFLDLTRPLSVDQLEASFVVDDPMTVTACPENDTSRARPARLLLGRLNNGQGADLVDRTGDLFAGTQAQRDSASMDPPGILRVVGFLTRCDNAGCTATTTLNSVQLSTVTVGIPFTLRVIWDAPNQRFLFGLDSNPNLPLVYDPTVFFREARLPFADTSVLHTTANCVGGPAVVDSSVRVGEFRTNTSAIIP